MKAAGSDTTREVYEKNAEEFKRKRRERYNREKLEKYELVIITAPNDYSKPVSTIAWNNVVKHIRILERKVRKLESYTY